jgi:hypothetical protein
MSLKEMSKKTVYFIKRGIIMNLHEECLLKYLLNPMDLIHSTELLKLNNLLIEEKKIAKGSSNDSRKSLNSVVIRRYYGTVGKENC